MSIIIEDNQFHLRTNDTSYIFSVFKEKWLTHLYWGSVLDESVDIKYIADEFIFSRANAFHVPTDSENRTFVSDLKLEFSTVGSGDYRTPTFEAEYENGSTVTELEYESYRVYNGKPKLEGLPALYSENDAETLEVTLVDRLTGLKAILIYSVFEKYDVITRSVRYENDGSKDIMLTSCQSATVDFSSGDFKVLNLYGDWARERNIEWLELGHSIINIDSKRGMSSHMHNPFIALGDEHADEYNGEIYAMSLVYSGNFSAVAEKNSCGGNRLSIGINPFNFKWRLKPNNSFQTPETVMVYSDSGLNNMSLKYHKVLRERLCRGKYRDVPRPMVINNWEGTAFDFDEDKLIDIAKKGAELGLELFVLDDGWFGNRNDDRSSLGDWYVNQKKLPNGLTLLANRINELGLEFGLWVEPEMISPDSDLYRKHPDWCIHCENRRRTENRNQLVLDLSREEVFEYITEQITALLQSANIKYIKWDCNRNITETCSMEQQHRYVLGLYKVLETLNQRFPDVLFEGCSGGGGRFDAGMLYYMPQTWTSDNTDPISRLSIQYGTSVIYPPISMTAHVGRIDVGYERENKFMNVCAMVAMSGSFGYEMDLSLLSETEMKQARGYVDLYKLIRPTIQFGDFYRLESPFDKNFVSWIFVDEGRAVLFTYQMKNELNGEERRIRLKGLDKRGSYECNDKVYSGDVLMKVGIGIPLDRYEYQSNCYIFNKISRKDN